MPCDGALRKRIHSGNKICNLNIKLLAYYGAHIKYDTIVCSPIIFLRRDVIYVDVISGGWSSWRFREE